MCVCQLSVSLLTNLNKNQSKKLITMAAKSTVLTKELLMSIVQSGRPATPEQKDGRKCPKNLPCRTLVQCSNAEMPTPSQPPPPPPPPPQPAVMTAEMLMALILAVRESGAQKPKKVNKKTRSSNTDKVYTRVKACETEEKEMITIATQTFKTLKPCVKPEPESNRKSARWAELEPTSSEKESERSAKMESEKESSKKSESLASAKESSKKSEKLASEKEASSRRLTVPESEIYVSEIAISRLSSMRLKPAKREWKHTKKVPRRKPKLELQKGEDFEGEDFAPPKKSLSRVSSDHDNKRRRKKHHRDGVQRPPTAGPKHQRPSTARPKR